MGKLNDADFKVLMRASDTPSGAAKLRKSVLEHRKSGGPMDAAHYEIFFETHLKLDKKRTIVGLVNEPVDPVLVELVDECLATIRDPKGARFLKGTGKHGWSRLAVLATLGNVCRFLGRYADACDAFERGAKSLGLTGPASVAYMRAAVRTKDRDTLEKALRAFEKVKNEAFAHAREYEKNKLLVKTLKSASGTIRTPKVRATPEGRIAEVIRVITMQKGKAKSFDGEKHQKPTPMQAAKLAKLTLPNGELPSDALRAWLAFDATWLPLFDKKGGWDVTKLGGRGDAFGKLPAGVKKDTLVIELPGSASQEHLLAFGKKPKKGGDYPVLGSEDGEVWVKFATFADFVSEYFGVG